MPKTYDLNYVKRLFEAIDFFKPERRSEIKDAIHQSLCRKFVTETNTLESILQLLALTCQRSLLDLQRMLITVIGCKYYLQWQDTFPEDARNDANPLFLEIFGSTRDGFWNFRDINGYIDKVYKESFLTNLQQSEERQCVAIISNWEWHSSDYNSTYQIRNKLRFNGRTEIVIVELDKLNSSAIIPYSRFVNQGNFQSFLQNLLMSLYFKERIDEQENEDPLNGRITFRYPWIITVPPRPADPFPDDIFFDATFGTNYNMANARWNISISSLGLSVDVIKQNSDAEQSIKEEETISLSDGFCFLSYNLYYDTDMRFLYYSSPKFQIADADDDEAKDEFSAKLEKAYYQRKITKIVFFVELHLPAKYFYRPMDTPRCKSNRLYCNKYPEDVENDYRFAFLKNSDFTIKCPDGSIPALRVILNLSSEFMKNYFATASYALTKSTATESTNNNELIVEHLYDVVKPIIIYIHTRCFKIPKVYDLNYVKRLLQAIDFLSPDRKNRMMDQIYLSLCHKFIEETHSFDSLLQWISFAQQHSFLELRKLLASTIAYKYYFKWQETFPEAARNDENPLFLEISGTDIDSQWIFEDIDRIYNESFLTNVILN